MKKINLKSVLVLVIIAGSSMSTYAQSKHKMMDMKHKDTSMVKMKHDHNQMMKKNHDNTKMMEMTNADVVLKDKNLNKAFMHYIMIKDALVNSETKKVQMMSKMLTTILNDYGNAVELSEISVKLGANEDLDTQRKLFAELTTAFEPLIKDNVSKGEIFKNYCPMANQKGAFWFSNSKLIVNPYMSKAMSSCGSVKETFKSL
jgi:hypothetical protein